MWGIGRQDVYPKVFTKLPDQVKVTPMETVFKQFSTVYVGPLVGKNAEEENIRMVFGKVDHTQCVYFVKENDVKACFSNDVPQSNSVGYNTIGHFFGTLNKDKERYEYVKESCNATEFIATIGGGRPTLRWGNDVGVQSFGQNIVSCFYVCSSVDPYCGHVISQPTGNTFIPVDPLKFEEEKSFVVGTDCEGYLADLEEMERVHTTLESSNLVFCGDSVDHGNKNLECLGKIESLRQTYNFKSLIGNRDINKVRLVELQNNCSWAHCDVNAALRYTIPTQQDKEKKHGGWVEFRDKYTPSVNSARTPRPVNTGTPGRPEHTGDIANLGPRSPSPLQRRRGAHPIVRTSLQ